MPSHTYIYTIFILLYLSYQDIKSQEIDSIIILLLFASTLFYPKYYDSFFLSLCINLCIYSINKEGIGTGDLLVIPACCLLIPLEEIGLFLILTGISSYIFGLIKKIKQIPLLPFITLAFILTQYKISFITLI